MLVVRLLSCFLFSCSMMAAKRSGSVKETANASGQSNFFDLVIVQAPSARRCLNPHKFSPAIQVISGDAFVVG